MDKLLHLQSLGIKVALHGNLMGAEYSRATRKAWHFSAEGDMNGVALKVMEDGDDLAHCIAVVYDKFLSIAPREMTAPQLEAPKQSPSVGEDDIPF